MSAIAQDISQATGQTIAYRPISPDIIYEKGPDLLAGYLFAKKQGMAGQYFVVKTTASRINEL